MSTDVSYLACAERLFRHRDVIYPMFATHNAHTIAAVLELRPPGAKFEFQRLHGMGALLHDEAKRQIDGFPRVRAYAPVGQHEELLSYLVRRLLENGANSSFVNRFMNESVPVDTVVEDPIAALQSADRMTNPHIPLPQNLYGESRENSAGVDWGNPQQLAQQIASLQKTGELPHAAPSTLAGKHSVAADGNQKPGQSTPSWLVMSAPPRVKTSRSPSTREARHARHGMTPVRPIALFVWLPLRTACVRTAPSW